MEHGLDAPKYLDGMFSWVLYDKKADRTIAARDPVGITSFYQGWSSTTPGAVYFASELKCLFPVCDKIKWFPPGKFLSSVYVNSLVLERVMCIFFTSIPL